MPSIFKSPPYPFVHLEEFAKQPGQVGGWLFGWAWPWQDIMKRRHLPGGHFAWLSSVLSILRSFLRRLWEALSDGGFAYLIKIVIDFVLCTKLWAKMRLFLI